MDHGWLLALQEESYSCIDTNTLNALTALTQIKVRLKELFNNFVASLPPLSSQMGFI